MHTVFLDLKTFDSNIDLHAIQKQVTLLTCFDITASDEVIERARNAEIIITNKVILSEAILSQLPSLKLICIAATGTNNVDLNAAKKLNIAVTNVSGYAQASVAQYTFAQLINYYTNITEHNSNTAKGLWQKSSTFCYHGNGFSELAGKTIGIIGYGNLGENIANIAQAFQMNVMIAERNNTLKIRKGRYAFEDVISQADIISLHCPHTPETENLINKPALEKMKPSAVLINTARGAVIDETALLNALQTKKIAHAFLDVLNVEPPTADHPLINAQLTNCDITAHIAWASLESQQRLIEGIANNIESFNATE